jgi:hypothetical protein
MAARANLLSMPDDSSTMIAESMTSLPKRCSKSRCISMVRTAHSFSMPADTSTTTAERLPFFSGYAFCEIEKVGVSQW